ARTYLDQAYQQRVRAEQVLARAKEARKLLNELGTAPGSAERSSEEWQPQREAALRLARAGFHDIEADTPTLNHLAQLASRAAAARGDQRIREQALAHWRELQRRFERRLAKRPGDAALMNELAYFRFRIGIHLAEAGQADVAIRSYAGAILLW